MNAKKANIIYFKRIAGFSSLFPSLPEENKLNSYYQFPISLIHKIRIISKSIFLLQNCQKDINKIILQKVIE